MFFNFLIFFHDYRTNNPVKEAKILNELLTDELLTDEDLPDELFTDEDLPDEVLPDEALTAWLRPAAYAP